MRRRTRQRGACLSPACGARVEAWQVFCGGCWRRLPVDIRQRIDAARTARQPHVAAAAAAEGKAWIVAHPPAVLAARVCGEASEGARE